MIWKPVFDFVASLLAKLAGPVLAFFAGKGYAEKKELERDAQSQKQHVDTLEQAARISDSVDLMPDDELERLREKLNSPR